MKETNTMYEHSVMALIIHDGKILTTHELIYGKLKISLPKGHVEKDETIMEAAIRETFEETNVMIKETDFKTVLEEYQIHFQTPKGQDIMKKITPILFVISDKGKPKIKEKNIVSIEYLDIEEFLSVCSYDNVKQVVLEAKAYLENN